MSLGEHIVHLICSTKPEILSRESDAHLWRLEGGLKLLVERGIISSEEMDRLTEAYKASFDHEVQKYWRDKVEAHALDAAEEVRESQ